MGVVREEVECLKVKNEVSGKVEGVLVVKVGFGGLSGEVVVVKK